MIDNNLIESDKVFYRFVRELNNFKNLKNGHSLIVGVSGGLDSMALLSLLVSTNSFDISVAHINHQLRSDSYEDETFVKNICEKLSIKFYLKRLEPKSRAKGHSVEDWARIQRYKFYTDIANIGKADWIMTAHHGNDQIETVLMNLSRKTGILGLRGIAKQKNKIIRPLLGFTKIELDDYINRIGIPYREDSSNIDISIPRNFLRHKVVKPWHNKIHNLVPAFNKSIENFIEWKESLDYLIIEKIIPELQYTENFIEIPTSLIEKMPKMVRIRLVYLLINKSNKNAWSRHTIELLHTFFEKKQIGNRIELNSNWNLLRDRINIIVKKDNSKNKKHTLELRLNHAVEFEKYRYQLTLNNNDSYRLSNNHEQLDWGKLKNSKLEIRGWKHGDRFQPLGMEGHQKLSDFLINQKVDRFSKDNQTVITADGKIIWVCGRRIANWVRLTDKTTQRVSISRVQINL